MAVRPPYGLKLFENVATGPRMPLEALNGQKLFEKLKKTLIFMIFVKSMYFAYKKRNWVKVCVIRSQRILRTKRISTPG